MEQVETIPFSSVISGMLLIKKSYTAIEVANVLSKIEGMGIVVDDEYDDLSKLSCCVEIGMDYSFSLKSDFSYNTILYKDVTVSKYLRKYNNNCILGFLNGDYFAFTNKKDEKLDFNDEFILSNYSYKVKKRILLKEKQMNTNHLNSKAINKFNLRTIFG